VSKLINIEAVDNNLSGTACALLLPLTLFSNNQNEISRKKFVRMIDWIKDYRTWNKYWQELEEYGVLVQLDKDTWLVSPNVCYSEEISHNTLINRWNEVRNAIS
jgi:hypothetical protein